MLIRADARVLPLSAGSVHMVVTSPPFWGLRDYGSPQQIGLEPMPDCLGWASGQQCGECYICQLVAVFRELRRVLRDDGTAWLNLGDSYFGDSPVRKSSAETFSAEWDPAQTRSRGGTRRSAKRVGALKPKDLCLIPARAALALQADGWYVRNDIIWHAPNKLTQSARDRVAVAHEYLFLLTKQAKGYYFDGLAIAEPASDAMLLQLKQGYDGEARKDYDGAGVQDPSDVKRRIIENMRKRAAARGESRPLVNKRSVWSIPTSNYDGAHFATFPVDLPAIAIQAGTSSFGCCSICSAPFRQDDVFEWRPICACRTGEVRPAIVLDPFFGSGTTGEAAERLGRRWIGIDLSYQGQAVVRTAQRGLPFAAGAAPSDSSSSAGIATQ